MAERKDKRYVMECCRENGIRFIRLWFTDVLGFLKGFAITINELEMAFEEGMGFDGSSIEGFARIEESDMIAKPDPSTFAILPCDVIDEVPMARMFCDIQTPEGEPFAGDPRWVLKRNLEKAMKLGLTFYVGPELEYFYFKSSESAEILDRGGYFDLTPLDIGSRLRKQTILILEQLGIAVEYSHHEVAPSQHEIDLRYTDALTMADYTMTYRYVVKEVAKQAGCYATFMPKPIFGENGSGMHVHQSLFKGDQNFFFDPDDEYHLSRAAKQYLAGLLKHSSEITAITNQWVNSYKRLVPKYEAPAYVSWGRRNRSALVRVPEYKPGKEKSTRIELRCADPACNPYLAFSVMLAAGLKGIEAKYDLPSPVEVDVYSLTDDELKQKNITTLPGNLFEAIQKVEESQLVRDALGEHIFNKFIENKKIEWENYRIQVTQYELDKYLSIL